ncbi:S9 family peptidase [Flammeovirgaceae bacterium SG7u.111]|nr:S9 family peptidase [Flammeovirgaceae bacterium SG7u.132]WPO35991.1 S9 family peptidase [Flammeovirgaceae bacterium SG7u.111]
MRKGLFIFLILIAGANVFAQKKITVQDIYASPAFYAQSVRGINWMNDGQYYSSQEGNDIVKYDVTTGEIVETIVDGDDLDPNISFRSYSFSADEKKVLLQTAIEPIYRRSFKAEYYVYDLESKKLQKLSDGGKQSYATFSPDGSKVAFARDNNLFYVTLSDMKEVQVTDDGKFNHIINGSADWVYEEEFSMAKAFFWSPDGGKLAYYTFNETEVPEYNMQVWADAKLYPIDYRFKYPKAGEKNSEINISIFHLADSKKVSVDIGTEKDIYIPRVVWTKDANLLSVRKMNRLQNKLEVLHVNAKTGESKAVLTEISKTYIDINDDLTYLDGGEQFIYTSERDGYNHIYLYNMDGSLEKQVTQGKWEVTSFVGVSQGKRPKVYYVSTEVSPMERHFYSIDLKKGKKIKLTKERGSHRVNMSNDFKYYIKYFSNSDTPNQVSLHKTEKNEIIKPLEENKELLETTKEFGFVKKEIFTLNADDGTLLHGYMLKPADFDENKKYPVLMHVYGGPGAIQVQDSWGGSHFPWHQMLTQNGYIVAVVDNRGTGAKGKEFKHVTYGQLGKYETQDQITAAKYLGSLGYIDKSRIGIWGWSYGGYMSSLCIMKGADVFKTAIAVAPVTTWRFYDTIYTERYLKLPQGNASGYDDNSPLSHVDKLKGNFLLIHGTGDDNVHFQNSVALQNALISAGKQFQSFYYPDRNHGIYGGNTRLHLFEMMTNYVKNNL